MRNLNQIAALLLAASSIGAAPPSAQAETSPTATVPAADAEAGKDVVHQLNSAFTKVFEIVAPSVVIIETTKKNEAGESPTL
jgi:S1-C subfamily serine protease